MHTGDSRLDTRDMPELDLGLCSPPRIIVAGRPRASFSGAGFTDALGRIMPVRGIDAAPTPRGMVRVMRQGAAAVRGGYEAVHLLDARLVPAALLLRARFGVPVTVALSAPDIPRRRPALVTQWLRLVDQAFAPDSAIAEAARTRLPDLAVNIMRRTAPAAFEPPARDLNRIVGMLRDVTPGRVVIAVPWPDDREQLRWLRDAVVPLLHGKPLILLLGAPGRREARLLTGAMGLQGTYRAHIGPLDAGVLAAAARCADVFVVPAAVRRLPDIDAMLLALAASNVPVVAGAAVCSDVLEHERNAFISSAEDAMSLVALLNSLLALPAVQRHYLGEDFAAYTRDRWSWEQAAGMYAARFASLVGRPQIPAELRAA
jgi:hypothetical protein